MTTYEFSIDKMHIGYRCESENPDLPHPGDVFVIEGKSLTLCSFNPGEADAKLSDGTKISCFVFPLTSGEVGTELFLAAAMEF